MKKSLFAAAVSSAMVMGAVMLPGIVFAATTSTIVSSTISPTISMLTSSGTVNLDAIPGSAPVQTIASDTVSVSTNNSAGYTLKLNETNGSTTMTSTTPAATIPATTGTKASPLALTANSWGYRVDGVGGFGATTTAAVSNAAPGSVTFAGVPTSASPDTIATTSATANNDTRKVWYGLAVDSSVPAGTYTNSVTYTAVVN